MVYLKTAVSMTIENFAHMFFDTYFEISAPNGPKITLKTEGQSPLSTLQYK